MHSIVYNFYAAHFTQTITDMYVGANCVAHDGMCADPHPAELCAGIIA